MQRPASVLILIYLLLKSPTAEILLDIIPD